MGRKKRPLPLNQNKNHPILPCYACFAGEVADGESANVRDTRISSPFSWRGDSFPPITDSETPEHLKQISDLGIPSIFDIHTHFFPETIMKLIWRWFDNANWAIGYRLPEMERVKRLHHNGIKDFTTLNYAHKKNMAGSLNDWTFANYKNWEGAIPFGTFYPEDGVLRYVKKAVEEYRFLGFKLHCEVSKLNLNDPELTDCFLYLEKKEIPIVIHTGTAPLPGEFTGIQFFKPFIKSLNFWVCPSRTQPNKKFSTKTEKTDFLNETWLHLQQCCKCWANRGSYEILKTNHDLYGSFLSGQLCRTLSGFQKRQ